MTTLPAAHSWIDKIAEVFQIVDREGAQLRSFKLAELDDFPNRITSTNTPCVVHYITDCQPLYSMGGPTILHWMGQSDFHLTHDVKPANLGRILQFYPLILAAAMSDVQLGGTVAHFVIPDQPGAMRMVTYRDENGAESHQGIEVRWQVKQSVSGSYTISA